MVKPLAIAAAVIGLLAWIAVPNLLEAMNRSHQKRGLADLRTIATAWEARATDRKTYAIGAKGRDPVDDTKVNWNALTPVSPAALQRALQPTYAKSLPLEDGWGRPFEFAAGDQTYAIRSLGRDGRADVKNGVYTLARTTSFDADVVYSNGSFIRGPEGM
jgi:type II secretory pathway pseudopilin PulG